MSDKTHLFTEKALRSLDRGPDTRSLTTFDSRRSRIFLAAATLLFAALIYWGFFGSMVESVSGAGVAMRERGIFPITSPGSGIVSSLNIREGSRVSRMQCVGQIYNAENFFRIRQAEAEYESLAEQTKKIIAGTELIARKKQLAEQNKLSAQERLKEGYAESRSRGKELSEAYQALLDAGAASKSDYYSVLDQALQTEASLGSVMMQSFETELSQENLRWEQERALLELESQRETKARELEISEKLFREASRIFPSSDGVITEVLKGVGSYVNAGERIALVSEFGGAATRVTAFVPFSEGKKIRPGMSVFFSPTTAKASEYGSIKGVVREVGTFAASAESVADELQNAELARALGGDAAVMRIGVELLPDRNTPSGLKWTSRRGAPMPIENGTPGTIVVNTEYRVPASYIIPFLREKLFGKDPTLTREAR